MSTAATPPGPSVLRLAASLPGIARNPMQFLGTMLDQFGPIVRLDGGVKRYYVVNHPDAFQHIFQTNQANYGKMTALEALMGEGLSVSKGSEWQQQRRRMQGAFDHSSLEAISAVVVEAAEEMLQRWESSSAIGEAIDLSAELARLSLDIVGRAMFGTRMDRDVEPLGESLAYLQTYLQQGFMTPQWLFPWRKARFDRAVAAIDRIVSRVIDERRTEASKSAGRHDLLSLLMAEEAYNGQPASKQKLRDNVMVMLLGGYETTSTALSWALYLLSRNPDAESRLGCELQAVLEGAKPTFSNLKDLRYARMVVDETMRLYPPAWVIPRRVKEDDEILGYRIRGGSMVLMALFAAHRDPRYWGNPETFEPERFSPERSAGRPTFLYVPFGGGQRKCPGYAFSLLEMTLALAAIVQRYRVHLASTEPVAPDPLLVLRPGRPLVVTVQLKNERAIGVPAQ